MNVSRQLLFLLGMGLLACTTAPRGAGPREGSASMSLAAASSPLPSSEPASAPTPPQLGVDFVSACRAEDASEARRSTIEKLLEVAKSKDCEQAWDKLKELQSLDLSASELSDIAPLAKLVNLNELTLSFNRIEDITPLEGLKNLRELFLGDNEIRVVTGLGQLAQLKTLDLGSNQIEDIGALSRLEQLEWLDLSKNKISKIEALGALRRLWFLSLANNEIEDIKALKQQDSLEELYLQGNRIKDLSPLETAARLLGLDVSQNPLGQSVKKSRENCPRSQQAGTGLREFCEDN